MQRRRSDERIRVKVIAPSRRDFYILRYTVDGGETWREQRSRIRKKKSLRMHAMREAGELEVKLARMEGEKDEWDWGRFCDRYTDEHLRNTSENNQALFFTARNSLDAFVGREGGDLDSTPLQEINASLLSRWRSHLKRREKRPLSDASVRSYMTNILVALRWAAEMEIIDKAPRPPRMERRKAGHRTAKARPIGEEEFDRLLMAAERVRPHDHERWQFLLRGLWLSGLRLGEALELSWDWSAPFAVIVNGAESFYSIDAAAEKGRRDRLLPIAPEFVGLLETTPKEDRSGRVFKLSVSRSTVDKVMARIGAASRVVVNKKRKTVTPHDLRRSFGTRWARRVKPAELQQLMRHASIETTMQFYVDIDAKDLADTMWKASTAQEASS